jgi:hypothetical protein
METSDPRRAQPAGVPWLPGMLSAVRILPGSIVGEEMHLDWDRAQVTSIGKTAGTKSTWSSPMLVTAVGERSRQPLGRDRAHRPARCCAATRKA